MPRQRKNPNCKVCGSVNPAGKSLCSKECKVEQLRRRTGYKGTKRPATPVPCAHCGSVMKARSSNGKAGRSRYCSHECLWQAKREQGAIVKASRANEAMADAERMARIMPELQALKRIARYVPRPKAWVAGCGCCGKSIFVKRTNGRPKSVCDDCTEQARARHQRIGRIRRRARMQGVQYQAIDPISVFERDGWQCYLCKRQTVKELRGTYEPLAPELEHIVPISRGGTHTWSNVACACRACNRAKGAKLLSEISIVSMG